MIVYVVLLGYLVVGYSLDHHCNKVGSNSTDSIDLSYQFGVREPIALERNPPTPCSVKLQWLWKMSETTHPMLV